MILCLGVNINAKQQLKSWFGEDLPWFDVAKLNPWLESDLEVI